MQRTLPEPPDSPPAAATPRAGASDELVALREAAEHFRRLFEDGPIAMSLVAHDYRLTDVNAAFCKLTGYTAAELRQRTFADITHPDDVETSLRLSAAVFAGERDGFSIDKRYVRKTGEVVWVELTASIIRDADGRPLKTLAVAKDIGERRRELAAAQDAVEQRAARERLQAAEAERARWARELHDETLQGLAGLHMLLSSEIPATPEGVRARIAAAQDQIENEMEKLRGLISELRPAALDELGLEASVRDLAERTQAVYGIAVETTVALDGAGAPRRPAAEVETAAYRIVQEALSNAARHARATSITVALAQRGGTLSVRVRDDGDGFDPAREAVGFGLRGMRERVDLLDGRLAISSHPRSGTEVTAVLPLRNA